MPYIHYGIIYPLSFKLPLCWLHSLTPLPSRSILKSIGYSYHHDFAGRRVFYLRHLAQSNSKVVCHVLNMV
ncbi:hypothetical protein C5472_12385 [Photorhabdus sp. RW14-46]|nr:hypothetical protein [Photorhabdus sp. RW14-46]